MILDELLEFADDLDVSAAAGTALAGDVIDLGAEPQDYEGMYLVIQVTTAFTSAGASETAFVLASDSVAAIATDGSATEHLITDAFLKGALVAGAQLVIPLPVGFGTLTPYERYLGILVVTSVATTTAGSINAFLTKDPKGWKAMPDAVN